MQTSHRIRLYRTPPLPPPDWLQQRKWFRGGERRTESPGRCCPTQLALPAVLWEDASWLPPAVAVGGDTPPHFGGGGEVVRHKRAPELDVVILKQGGWGGGGGGLGEGGVGRAGVGGRCIETRAC